MTGPAPDLAHVAVWVFDLDNTLYPSECDLFAQIDQRMTAFVAEALGVDAAEARAVQKRYYAEHGTTLNGLMRLHGVEPDDYLDYVHDIDLTPVEACANLRARIDALPGRKIVFTNGSRAHAERVVDKRGLAGLFDAVFDIAEAGFEPKPFRAAYDRLVERFAIAPERAAMFEDLPRNLEVAHAMGFTTVLVRTTKDWSHEPIEARPAGPDADHDHVHFATDDLAAFLGRAQVSD
ncbi:MAG: pyrimidine 5'-nucleotidase [Caulobacterales bacterium]|nr:pyrimidine 5'-nucleotidase [Caulobacterales bacterium]